MTTEATQGPQPATPPEMDASDVREVYRILGGLERGQTEIKERLDRQDQRFARHEERNEQQFARHEEHNEQQFARHEERFDRYEERSEQRYRETNRRIDRLWYTIVGFGLAVLAGMAGLALQNALFD